MGYNKEIIQDLDVTIDNLVNIRDQLSRESLKAGDWVMTIPKGNPNGGFSVFLLASQESADRYAGPECNYEVIKVRSQDVDQARKDLECGRR